jgi:spore maturation protein CgeB
VRLLKRGQSSGKRCHREEIQADLEHPFAESSLVTTTVPSELTATNSLPTARFHRAGASPLRILLFDTTAHASPWPLFLEDLGGLAHENPDHFRYAFVDEARFLLQRSFSDRATTRVLDWVTMNVRNRRRRAISYRAASRLLGYRRHPVSSSALNEALMTKATEFRPNLMVVLMGFHIAPEVVAAIRNEIGAITVNYATDDPFNWRTGTPELIKSIPHYDVYATTKRAIIPDVKRAGGRDVRYVRFGYKSSVHFYEPPVLPDEQKRFSADVAFAGEADADRLPFFRALLRAIPNLNLALYGGLWNQDGQLRRYFRGAVRGRDFRMAHGGAKIVVNLVRRENRDDHVMRTFEAPACGAFMLHERTESHLDIYKEGRDAAFFESSDELIDKVRYYLLHEHERERIRQAGYSRTISGGHSYRNRLEQILQAASPHPESITVRLCV